MCVCSHTKLEGPVSPARPLKNCVSVRLSSLPVCHDLSINTSQLYICCNDGNRLSRRLSSLPTYYIPKDGPLSSYKEYISMLPNLDHPEAFGQHPNADITSQIQETRMMFDTLLSLQPQITTGTGESREDKVRVSWLEG